MSMCAFPLSFLTDCHLRDWRLPGVEIGRCPRAVDLPIGIVRDSACASVYLYGAPARPPRTLYTFDI